MDLLIRSLYNKINEIYDLQTPLLPAQYKEAMFEALVNLNKSSKLPIVGEGKLRVTSVNAISGQNKLVYKKL